MPSNKQIRYFDKFGTVDYDFTNAGGIARMTNFTKFIEFSDVGDISSYFYYDIQPGDRPETLAQEFFNNPEYTWMLFLINPHLRAGMSAWPLTDNQMDDYLAQEYDDYCWVSGDVIRDSDISESRYIGDIPFGDDLNELKYLPYLRLTYDTGGGDYPFTSLKIKSYDHQRFGLVVYKGDEAEVADLNLTGDDITTFGVTHDDSYLGAEWRQKCLDLGLTPADSNDSPSNRDTFLFRANNLFSNILLKNATYQYYIDSLGETEGSVLVPFRLLTHYEVLKGGASDDQISLVELNRYEDDGDDDPETNILVNEADDFNIDSPGAGFTINLDAVSKISFYENEAADNDLKKKIKIPRAESVNELARKYYKLIKR